MTNLKPYFAGIISVFFLLIISGCQSIYVRGQFVSDRAIEQINIKKPSKEELMNVIGTPTYVPDYSAGTWYYIQRSLAHRAWLDPKVIEQRIVKITFATNKRVSQAVLLKDAQNEVIVANSAFTKTHGTEQTGIQKFVKNISRFNQTTNGSGRRKGKK
jgi:outer membrane protein assembly factor BamE (lipoprotein component of BamABCDE complex)